MSRLSPAIASLVVLATGLASGAGTTRASAERARRSGLAVGPISTGSEVGLRGGFDSNLLLIALERYDEAGRVRTRGEVALRIPLRLSRRIMLAPQLGIVPVDYATTETGDRWLGLSATLTARFDLLLWRSFSLVAEPLRLELGVAEIDIPAQPREMPEVERPWSLSASAFVGLRVGW